jgi:hypothetical protein
MRPSTDWYRWLAVVPLALVAALFTQMMILWILSRTFSHGGSSDLEWLQRAIPPTGTSAVFVWTGAQIAPAARRMSTGAALLVFWSVVVVAPLIISLRGLGPGAGPRGALTVTVNAAIANLIGGVIGFIAVRAANRPR